MSSEEHKDKPKSDEKHEEDHPAQSRIRRLSDTLIDVAEQFAEQVGEGARQISEHVKHDGEALAGYMSGGKKD